MTFRGGPLHNQRDLRHDVQASMIIPPPMARLRVLGRRGKGQAPVARESFHDSTCVLQGHDCRLLGNRITRAVGAPVRYARRVASVDDRASTPLKWVSAHRTAVTRPDVLTRR